MIKLNAILKVNEAVIKNKRILILIIFTGCIFLGNLTLHAQFMEEFEYETEGFSHPNLKGWNTFTGDGEVFITEMVHDGYATLRVDARKDKRNIWYALTQHDVTEFLDLKKLAKPNYELKIEARVRPSHAPRRCNLYILNLDTEIDWLREFDLAEAGKWHYISMTTQGLEFDTSKRILGQVSFMDWGKGDFFELDVDYLKVSVVNTKRETKTNLKPETRIGTRVRYRPLLADVSTFEHEIKVSEDVTLDLAYPEMNFNKWVVNDEQDVQVLNVDNQRVVALRWDFADLEGKIVDGEGQLEIYTHSLFRLAENAKDFGEIRFHEILGGSENWQDENLTYKSFLAGEDWTAVINTQTTVDAPVNPEKGGKTAITVSQPVLQRLLNGTTKGIAIVPLGAVNALLMASETENGKWSARLRFNLE